MNPILFPAAVALAFGLASCQSTTSNDAQGKPVASVPSVTPYPLKT